MKSIRDSNDLVNIRREALTDDINNRELYMKGIDTSYYYENKPVTWIIFTK